VFIFHRHAEIALIILSTFLTVHGIIAYVYFNSIWNSKLDILN